jgi:hypothetical protein
MTVGWGRRYPVATSDMAACRSSQHHWNEQTYTTSNTEIPFAFIIVIPSCSLVSNHPDTHP